MTPSEPLVTAYFAERMSDWPPTSPLHTEAKQLAEGIFRSADRISLPEVQAMSPTPAMRGAELDMILGFLTYHFERGASVFDLVRPVRLLKRYFDVQEGEFIELRPAELASLVQAQLEAIFAEGASDPYEDVRQVELQAFFDLGYDDFLALGRSAYERAYTILRDEQLRGGPRAGMVGGKLAALEPVFRLASVRRRRSGALY